MRKWKILLLVFICVVGLTACANGEVVLHLGVNAVIDKIDIDNQQITVKGTDTDSMLGENCVISCKGADMI